MNAKLSAVLNAETVALWDYGTPIFYKPTGRYIDSASETLIYVELKRGLFEQKWAALPMIDLVSKMTKHGGKAE